jgi:hypothetical protein
MNYQAYARKEVNYNDPNWNRYLVEVEKDGNGLFTVTSNYFLDKQFAFFVATALQASYTIIYPDVEMLFRLYQQTKDGKIDEFS